MDLRDDLWTDGFVSLVAVLGLPFYLGYVHAAVDTMLEYAIVAGLALALGERLIYSFYRGNAAEFAVCAGLRALAVMVWGGVSFGLAWWLV